MTRFEVYDNKYEVSWGIFDDVIEADALKDELEREDYTREIDVYEVDENGNPYPINSNKIKGERKPLPFYFGRALRNRLMRRRRFAQVWKCVTLRWQCARSL